MAWNEEEFAMAYHSEGARIGKESPIAMALCQLGALLAERLPKPRLYTFKRTQTPGDVVDLTCLSYVEQVREVEDFDDDSSPKRKLYCVAFSTGGGFDYGAYFLTREDAEAERAELLAAWGGSG